MNISYPKTFKRGFSLLELLAVIAIIAILVGIIVATYMMAMGKRDEKKIEAEMEAIKLPLSTTTQSTTSTLRMGLHRRKISSM